ncbi:MAG: hypothetical protein HQL52_15180, partial [Magnetococcales bacterium]|nr:hypothetical protein [Magnetococcales bacterium]
MSNRPRLYRAVRPDDSAGFTLKPQLVLAYERACNDLEARFTVLLREAKHLQTTAAYLSNNPHVLSCLKTEEEFPQTKPPIDPYDLWPSSCQGELTDSTAWLVRPMAIAVQQIKKDIWYDLRERLDEMHQRVFEWNDNEGRQSSGATQRDVLIDVREFLLYQTILRNRAGIYADMLGKLQDRLGQTLEHVYPEQPGPTVRRRMERKIADTYLTALCRWSHRDLVILAKDKFDCEYPFKTLPMAVQFWEHESTSRHTSMQTDRDYRLWRQKIFESKREDRKKKNNAEIQGDAASP